MRPLSRSLLLLLPLLGCGGDEGPAPLDADAAELRSAECAQGQPVVLYARLVPEDYFYVGDITRLTVSLWWAHLGEQRPLSRVEQVHRGPLPRSVALCADPSQLQVFQQMRFSVFVETADQRYGTSGELEHPAEYFPWSGELTLRERRLRQVL
jgi:hypothetical protein